MIPSPKSLSVKNVMLLAITMITLNACDRSSSPEGRMSMKLEEMHKEMIDSFQKQNEAILDSLGKIHEELRELKQHQK